MMMRLWWQPLYMLSFGPLYFAAAWTHGNTCPRLYMVIGTIATLIGTVMVGYNIKQLRRSNSTASNGRIDGYRISSD